MSLLHGKRSERSLWHEGSQELRRKNMNQLSQVHLPINKTQKTFAIFLRCCKNCCLLDSNRRDVLITLDSLLKLSLKRHDKTCHRDHLENFCCFWLCSVMLTTYSSSCTISDWHRLNIYKWPYYRLKASRVNFSKNVAEINVIRMTWSG